MNEGKEAKFTFVDGEAKAGVPPPPECDTGDEDETETTTADTEVTVAKPKKKGFNCGVADDFIRMQFHGGGTGTAVGAAVRSAFDRLRKCWTAPTTLTSAVQSFVNTYLPRSTTRGVGPYVLLWTRLGTNEPWRNTPTIHMVMLIFSALQRGYRPVLMGEIARTADDPDSFALEAEWLKPIPHANKQSFAAIRIGAAAAKLVVPTKPADPKAVRTNHAARAAWWKQFDVVDLRGFHALEPFAAEGDRYLSQLQFFRLLIERVESPTARDVLGQIGWLSGGMDGAALMGLPTVQFGTASKLKRMLKWSAPYQWYEDHKSDEKSTLPDHPKYPIGVIPTYRNVELQAFKPNPTARQWTPAVLRTAFAEPMADAFSVLAAIPGTVPVAIPTAAPAKTAAAPAAAGVEIRPRPQFEQPGTIISPRPKVETPQAAGVVVPSTQGAETKAPAKAPAKTGGR